MIRKLALSLVLVGGLGMISACATKNESLGNVLNTTDLVYNGNAEALPDKIDVYKAMARAVKYNTDVAAQNLYKKIYGNETSVYDVTEELFAEKGNDDKLSNAMKAMDFVDVYAMSLLADNKRYVENLLYAKSAQNLSLAAIKNHRELIFANKEINQVNNILRQQTKVLKSLEQKNNDGTITEPEINYLKGLEVELGRLEDLRTQSAFAYVEYSNLINTQEKNIKLEGKRFYELDDFDKEYSPELFQNSAVSNRKEFVLAKEKLGGFNAAKTRRRAFSDYPTVARLDINGLKIEDARYEKELFEKAKKVTFNLLNALEKYNKNPENEEVKQKAFDELAALVLTQVEAGYRLVEKTTFDFEANKYQIQELKNNIKEMRKKNNKAYYDKIDLLKAENDLIYLEQKEVDILAQRAMALRNLYYLAGLSPFDKTMLKQNTSGIERDLKKAFNNDLIEMLSSVKESERWDDGGNAWAHKDNWLEELIEAPKKAKKQPVVAKTTNNNVILQFGSYIEKANAFSVRDEIKEKVPDASGVDMVIEEAVIGGNVYHRLMLRTTAENGRNLCNKVIDAGFDCILR